VQAALLYGQEDLRLEEVPTPTPAAGEVVLQVAVATTCGTDLKVWRRGGHARMLKPPTLFGHEAAGRIVALGAGVTGWQVGDRVVANNSAPCMTCFFCQKQEFSLCTHLIFNNGTFAEYLKIPAAIVQHNLLPIPDALPHELAALTEPLACVLHGIARSDIQLGDRIVILGDGAIGLMFAGVLAYYKNQAVATEPSATQPMGTIHPPAAVYLLGGHESRLQIAERFGVDQTFHYRQIPDVPSLVRDFTEGWGADVVIEATGIPAVWETAIACARPGGTVNLFGGCPRETTITVSTEQLHYNELTLKGVFHNTPIYVRAALDLLSQRVIPLEWLISQKRALSELEQVFQEMRDRKVIKVAMIPHNEDR